MKFIQEIIAEACGIIISKTSKALRIGAGATWPGEIALSIDPNILSKLLRRIRKGIIIVAGTNGKTTTSGMITYVLEQEGHSVIHNASGANLINGIVSSFITDSRKTYDYGVFEVDENTLPLLLRATRNISVIPAKSEISQTFLDSGSKAGMTIVLLNLFRDQLDRYGEVDTIAKKWLDALRSIDSGNQYVKPYHATILINADDPQLAYIGQQMQGNINTTKRHPERSEGSRDSSAFSLRMTELDKNNIMYFGLSDKRYYLSKMQHATDSIYCPKCSAKLTFTGVYFSHLGDWKCTSCGLSKPKLTITDNAVWSPLEGVYNLYNAMAAVFACRTAGVPSSAIAQDIAQFTPAFGRQELIRYKGKDIIILLSKNPTGFNESIRTVLHLQKKGPILLVLNDRIPDGTDVSWIWDVDFEQLDDRLIVISGDRYLDMGVRMKYATPVSNIKNQKYKLHKELLFAINGLHKQIRTGETGWILATYSAMLDVRKILVGRSIL